MKTTLLSLIIGLIVANSAKADLKPEDIAIIANASSDDSKRVAAHYAQKRGIPRSQIFVAPFSSEETMSRNDWDTKTRPQIRNWLREKKLSSKIQCFVTVYGVPLKIDKATRDIETMRSVALLRGELRSRVSQLNRLFSEMHDTAATEKTDYQPISETSTRDDLTKKFQEEFGAAQERVQALADETAKQEATVTLRTLFVQSVGIAAYELSVTRQMGTLGSANTNQQAELSFLRGQLAGLRESRANLESSASSVERDLLLLNNLSRTDGISGSIIWINEELEQLNKNESHTSFDSELALVAWSNYALARWQPNYHNVRFRHSSVLAVRPSYMVARIDGPSVAVATRMVDDAVATEATGLRGKAYFDSRGLTSQQPVRGSQYDYDQSLVNAAEFLKKYTTLDVVVENSSDLFKAGACPDAALYCGWYSLGNYIDAFTWNPGSIGFHIASSEASTLRRTDSNVWCKKILEKGACATCGPVYENNTAFPGSFPRPEQFFLLLVSGKYTLGECYHMTKPFSSWTMTLLGDPLYNPFKNSKALKTEELPLQLKQFVDGA